MLAASGLAAAKDLTAQAPRGLEGCAWLPRMLVQGARHPGRHGRELPVRLPVDHTCMAGDSPLRAGAVYGAAGIVSSRG